ncbi:MurR/RpiR family transcriptional regulator [Schleiferilactobacillus perolens]|jgi:DNA-binding MurR/RpiR family transcriptional regulator|uniref:Transcriptional regulator n=1 Tax=Schleiferilactobacillus perolens DSM 12744 TaxID=1423792 RepID=A0A0R1MT76_9LACO|nr:MurR/RpiR family transcriptional regulator [Schleiferilactobacillus perolens]KRL11360.1 transcriptional regulator [Schleiferilactobacillus perolens DSM 12744]MCI1891105.1 MurR/RpiR family transcriptional regulator [Schleiferilactobacillus harbinensis]MCI1911973.1 MurR/RpiR family transcriptional regulator [Schleiferilactobacillus harbinensis]MCI2170413.1 MurR/RpiR family transcriptional regulator [Schleiferilactobacillus perolens]
MPIKRKITNTQNSMSEAEEKVANYVLAHPQPVLNMTVSQLARAAQTSAASVVRLSKRIGVAGFTAFKIELAADLTKQNIDIDPDADITRNESLSVIKEKLLYNAKEALQDTVDQIDPQAFTDVNRLLGSAKQIYIFGVGASFLTAQNIAQKWSRIGYPATAMNDLNVLLPAIANGTKRDMLWVVSNSGETPEVIYAAQTAKKSQVSVVSLTKLGKNSVTAISDVAIHTSLPIERRHRIAATNSLMTQFMVVDLLFYDFVSHHYDASTRALNQSKHIIEQYQTGK